MISTNEQAAEVFFLLNIFNTLQELQSVINVAGYNRCNTCNIQIKGIPFYKIKLPFSSIVTHNEQITEICTKNVIKITVNRIDISFCLLS